VEAPKIKTEKKRMTAVTTFEMEKDKEEDIENNTFYSESNCFVVASDISISKWGGQDSDQLPLQ
jgi:hypothetical protein